MKNIKKISDEKIYLTVLSDEFLLGNSLVLRKDLSNVYDTEAIFVDMAFLDEDDFISGEQFDVIEDMVYVANSVGTVVMGTYSAGRVYDKFKEELVVKVVFSFKGRSIVEVLGETVPDAQDDKE